MQREKTFKKTIQDIPAGNDTGWDQV